MSFARAPVRSSFATSNPSAGGLRDPSPRPGGDTSGRREKGTKNTSPESGWQSSPVAECSMENETLSPEVERLQALVAEQALKLMVLESGAGVSGCVDRSELEQFRGSLEDIHQLLCSAMPALGHRDGNQSPSATPNKKRNEDTGSLRLLLSQVKEAALQHKSAFSSLQRKNDANARLIRAMERELGQFRAQKSANANGNHKGTSSDAAVSLLPYSSEELLKLRSELEALQDDYRRAASTVRTLQYSLEKREKEADQLRDELQRERALVVVLETAQEKELGVSPGGSRRGGSFTPHSTPSKSLQSSSPGKEKTPSGKETTHHVRLFTGKDFVTAHQVNPEAFKVAVMDDLCATLPILMDAVRYFEVRAGSRSVTVEVDIRHPASLTESEIEFRLWTFDFPQVEMLTDRASATPADHAVREARSKHGSPAVEVLTQQLRETRGRLTAKEEEIARLEQRLTRQKEAQQEDNSAVDDTVNAVLKETENTIIDLQHQLSDQDEEYNTLVDAYRELEQELNKVRAEQEDLKSITQKGAAKEEEAVKLELEHFRTEVKVLQDELHQVSMEKSQLEDAAAESLLTATSEVFEAFISVPTVELAELMVVLLDENAHTVVIQAILLSHVAGHSGAIPLRLRRCTVDTSRLVVRVKAELGFACMAAEKEAHSAKLKRQLEQPLSCSALGEYLHVAAVATAEQVHQESSPSPHRVSISENQELSDLLQQLLSLKERMAAPSTTEQLALVAQKYKEMESAAQKTRIEAVQASTRLRVKDNENERLRKELRELKLGGGAAAKSDTSSAAVLQLEDEVTQLKKDLEEAQLRGRGQDMLIAEQNQLVEALHQQVQEYAALQQDSPHGKSPGSPCRELCVLQAVVDKGVKERERLMKQIKELEVDMNDLVNIQHSLQESNELAQRKLRAAHNEKEELKQRITQLAEEKKALQNPPLDPNAKQLSKILKQSISLLRHNITKASSAAGVRPELVAREPLPAQLEPRRVDPGAESDDVARATTELYSLAQQLGTVMDPLVEVSTPRMSQKTVGGGESHKTEGADGGVTSARAHHYAGSDAVASRLAGSSRYAAWSAGTSRLGSSAAASDGAASTTRGALLELANRRYAASRAALEAERADGAASRQQRTSFRSQHAAATANETSVNTYLPAHRRSGGSAEMRSSSSRITGQRSGRGGPEEETAGYRRTASRGAEPLHRRV